MEPSAVKVRFPKVMGKNEVGATAGGTAGAKTHIVLENWKKSKEQKLILMDAKKKTIKVLNLNEIPANAEGKIPVELDLKNVKFAEFMVRLPSDEKISNLIDFS